MKLHKLFLIISLISLTSCAKLMQVAQSIDFENNAPLTQNEIIAGLKEALIVGTDSSASKLGLVNGYYGDELVKVLLPPEADMIVKNARKIPGGEQLIEDVILKINRAAEDAALEAKPIFVNSIRSMTIADALGILKGEEDAATQYLKKTTYTQLTELYSPKIKTSLDKKIIGNISTTDSWNKLTGEWNKIARSMIGQIGGLEPVNISLENYLTEQALNGLFFKIAEEEKQIRTDPVARVTNLLKRVFGQNN